MDDLDSSVEASDQSEGESRMGDDLEDPTDQLPEEGDVSIEVENRKSITDCFLDKFEEVCPKSQLGCTRMFKKHKKNSKSTRHQMLD